MFVELRNTQWLAVAAQLAKGSTEMHTSPVWPSALTPACSGLFLLWPNWRNGKVQSSPMYRDENSGAGQKSFSSKVTGPIPKPQSSKPLICFPSHCSLHKAWSHRFSFGLISESKKASPCLERWRRNWRSPYPGPISSLTLHSVAPDWLLWEVEPSIAWPLLLVRLHWSTSCSISRLWATLSSGLTKELAVSQREVRLRLVEALPEISPPRLYVLGMEGRLVNLGGRSVQILLFILSLIQQGIYAGIIQLCLLRFGCRFRFSGWEA